MKILILIMILGILKEVGGEGGGVRQHSTFNVYLGNS